jgi:hypothetical protein
LLEDDDNDSITDGDPVRIAAVHELGAARSCRPMMVVPSK